MLIVYNAKISQFCSISLHLVKALSKSAGSGACRSHLSGAPFTLSTTFQGTASKQFLCDSRPQVQWPASPRTPGACPSLRAAQMPRTSALWQCRSRRGGGAQYWREFHLHPIFLYTLFPLFLVSCSCWVGQWLPQCQQDSTPQTYECVPSCGQGDSICR